MKIAVTYENGNIFQHFGHTENFKVYDAENGEVKSAEILGSNGSGHGALAGLLAGNQVDVLICGGIGPGAQNALADAGVELVSGIEGNADEAVEAYLKGELVSAGATCDHHGSEGGCHGEGEHCGHHAGGNCGGNCGGRPGMEGPNVGKQVRVHYKGTLDDGSQFDSSYDRGETLDFVCGAGMMIVGFDKAVAKMTVGEIVDVHLLPEEAYGMPDPNAVFSVDVSMIPGSEDLKVGEKVYLTSQSGTPFPVTVTAREGSSITFDANHELAGQALNFRIELVEVL